VQALEFVRDRHSFADEDLQRIQDQRAFLKALLDKATSPSVFLKPFKALSFGATAASSISVNKGTQLYELLQVALALRNAETGTVPVWLEIAGGPENGHRLHMPEITREITPRPA
jgi:anionic cell wall polymer biosynthesis LytR-Cps2A-Psr (LCP) family protein